MKKPKITTTALQVFSNLVSSTFNNNDDFSYINCGGCGAFALMLGIKLQKLGLRVQYHGYNRNKRGLNIKAIMSSDKKYNSVSDHIIVYVPAQFVNKQRIDAFYLDAQFGKKRTVEDTHYHYWNHTDIIPEKVLKKMCNKVIGWNSMFDRKLIPVINDELTFIIEEVFEVTIKAKPKIKIYSDKI